MHVSIPVGPDTVTAQNALISVSWFSLYPRVVSMSFTFKKNMVEFGQQSAKSQRQIKSSWFNWLSWLSQPMAASFATCFICVVSFVAFLQMQPQEQLRQLQQ